MIEEHGAPERLLRKAGSNFATLAKARSWAGTARGCCLRLALTALGAAAAAAECAAAAPPCPRPLALHQAIVFQQLATTAAAKIYGRVLAACGGGELLSPAGVLAAPVADLRAAGLSERKARLGGGAAGPAAGRGMCGAPPCAPAVLPPATRLTCRPAVLPACCPSAPSTAPHCPSAVPQPLCCPQASYIKDLAQHWADGRLSDDGLAGLSEAQLEAALTRVKGIGVWTVHMHAMFHLGAPLHPSCAGQAAGGCWASCARLPARLSWQALELPLPPRPALCPALPQAAPTCCRRATWACGAACRRCMA